MAATNTAVTNRGSDDVAELEPCGENVHPDCGVCDVLDGLGDKWSVLVIELVAGEPRRFRELQ